MSSAREPRPTATYSVSKPAQSPLRQALADLLATELAPGPYETWRLRVSAGASQALLILYQSGKLVISGQAPAFDQAASIVESQANRVPAKAAPTTEADSTETVPSETEPHIGTDEAGKGDFFGPLVTAGVYVDGQVAQILRTLNVRDSKTVSDRELPGLALKIRQVVDEGRRAVLVLAPKRYNELYQQMRSEGKNLNTLLAWTHTRVIEDLIKSGLRPDFILSDQFGNKRYIESRLLMDTRLSGIPVLQRHRAEADVGVAAASILARDGFVRWLDQASKRLGVTLPKGASPNVIQTARTLVSRSGPDALNEYAKVSFKTMQKVLAP